MGADEERQDTSASGAEPEVHQSEAALDALDATPENRRRSALVLGIIGALFACAVAMVVIVPPLSGQVSKDADSHYHELSSVSVTEAGAEGREFSYAAVTGSIFYALEASQETRYGNGGVSRMEFRGVLELSRPELRHFDDEVTLKFSRIDVHVYDGGGEVGLSETGRMLEGIALYTRLTGRGGLLNVYPEAKINPQVGRVLYMLSDAVRGLWVPFPGGAIGRGGRYRVSDHGEGAVRRVGVTAGAVSASGGTFSTEIEVSSSGSKVGAGHGSFAVSGGLLERSSYEIRREGAVISGGAERQEVSVRAVRVESPEAAFASP